jgi:hypothetical protein
MVDLALSQSIGTPCVTHDTNFHKPDANLAIHQPGISPYWSAVPWLKGSRFQRKPLSASEGGLGGFRHGPLHLLRPS